LLGEPMLSEARQTGVGALAETKILRLRPRGPENGATIKATRSQTQDDTGTGILGESADFGYTSQLAQLISAQQMKNLLLP